jgi:hypothetical protein
MREDQHDQVQLVRWIRQDEVVAHERRNLGLPATTLDGVKSTVFRFNISVFEE